VKSNQKFRISDLRCRIRPISKSPPTGAWLVKYVDALCEEGNSKRGIRVYCTVKVIAEAVADCEP